jgi:hypothetical protein
MILGLFFIYAATVPLRLAIGPQKGVFLGFFQLPDEIMMVIDYSLALIAALSGIGLIIGVPSAWYLAFGYQTYALAYLLLDYDIFKHHLASHHPEIARDMYFAIHSGRVILNLLPFLVLFVVRELYHPEIT